MGISLWWQQLLLVMIGGALGAAGRFWLGGVLLRHLGNGFPWGTWCANLAGSFMVGFLAAWLEGRGQMALYWRSLLIVGVLGAFTTYSALMFESLLFLKSGRASLMLVYLASTFAAGLLLVWLGFRSGIWLRV
jgi:fluoride exporter